MDKFNEQEQREQRVGPDLQTHMAAAVDLEKTTVRQRPEVVEEVEQGPGAYDHRNSRDDD